MQSIAKIERKKEVFKVTQDELLKDKWVEKIREEIKNGNKVEFNYINSILSLRTYFIKGDENKGELVKDNKEE